MASRNIFLPKESNRRIPNGTYGGVRGMNNLYSIGECSEPIRRMLIMPYDIESQSRNALASPLGEEGHEVAKGCTRVRMIMILDVDVTAAGGIIKLIAR